MPRCRRLVVAKRRRRLDRAPTTPLHERKVPSPRSTYRSAPTPKAAANEGWHVTSTHIKWSTRPLFTGSACTWAVEEMAARREMPSAVTAFQAGTREGGGAAGRTSRRSCFCDSRSWLAGAPSKRPMTQRPSFPSPQKSVVSAVTWEREKGGVRREVGDGRRARVLEYWCRARRGPQGMRPGRRPHLKQLLLRQRLGLFLLLLLLLGLIAALAEDEVQDTCRHAARAGRVKVGTRLWQAACVRFRSEPASERTLLLQLVLRGGQKAQHVGKLDACGGRRAPQRRARERERRGQGPQRTSTATPGMHPSAPPNMRRL